MPSPSLPPDEAELDELPPLDGDAGDVSDPDPAFEEPLDDADSEATLDDSTGEEDEPESSELDVGDEEDGGWLAEPTEAPDLDLWRHRCDRFRRKRRRKQGEVCPAGQGALPSMRARNVERGIAEEDLGFGDSPGEGVASTAADEGPVDPDRGAPGKRICAAARCG